MLTLRRVEPRKAQGDDRHAVPDVHHHAQQAPHTDQCAHVASAVVFAAPRAQASVASCDTPPASTVARTRPGSAVPVAAKSNGVCLPWLISAWRDTCHVGCGSNTQTSATPPSIRRPALPA